MKSIGYVVVVALMICGLFLGNVWAEDVTLQMWDDITWEVEDNVVKALITEFEQQNNCKVERTTRPLEDTKSAVMAAVRSGKVADIILVNNGETMMGPLVRGGYLLETGRQAQGQGHVPARSRRRQEPRGM